MALCMTVLASGSKGNCTVVSSARTRLLIDAGLSCRETLKRMKLAGEDPDQLSAILITHEHSDHVNGLSVLARKLGIPVYMTGTTHHAWYRCIKHEAKKKGEDPRDVEKLEFFEAGKSFCVGDIDVTAFTVPHDAVDPVGFTFKIEGVKLGYVTDLGYMPVSVKQHLKACDGLLIESNHDLEMLRVGPYPWSVKQRVLSRVGHLSNKALADFFSEDYDGGAAFVVLAHLSEQNNHPEVARICAEQALGSRRSLLHTNALHLASQTDPMPAIRL